MGNNLNTIKRNPGKTIFGGIIGAGIIAGGIFFSSLSSTGEEMKNDPFAAFLPIVADVTATGSTSASTRYDATCIPVPQAITGSSSVVRLAYHNVRNPAAASVDIGFVDSCNAKTSSGQTLIDNACTATGCVAYYTTGTAAWQGGKFIKTTISKNPTSSYDAKLTIWVEEILGE